MLFSVILLLLMGPKTSPKSGKSKWSATHTMHSARISQPHQPLQMWSDWYTIFHAQRVYHIHSHFSLSAVHWKNNGPSQRGQHHHRPHESYAIRGWDASTQRLMLLTPSWWSSSEEKASSTGANTSHCIKNNQRNFTVLSSSTKRPPPVLSQRSPRQLLHCDLTHSGLDAITSVFDLDDEIPP